MGREYDHNDMMDMALAPIEAQRDDALEALAKVEVERDALLAVLERLQEWGKWAGPGHMANLDDIIHDANAAIAKAKGAAEKAERDAWLALSEEERKARLEARREERRQFLQVWREAQLAKLAAKGGE
jgi:multidrug efflux pump subunit AcrA (membrane-fusion protein)